MANDPKSGQHDTQQKQGGRSNEGSGRRSPKRWLRRFRRLSLRARLIAAFLILIVTSAAATVVIGNVVFGQKVVELATSKMEVGLKVAQLGLSAHLERMQLLAQNETERGEDGETLHAWCHGMRAQIDSLDFVLRLDPRQGTLLRLANPPASTAAGRNCEQFAFAPDPALAPELHDFLQWARRHANVKSGLLVLRRTTMQRLHYPQPPAEGLFLAVAAPLSNGSILMLGTLLNGRTDLIAAPVDLLWPNQRRWYAASLFLRETRVATTVGPQGLGTQADRQVVRRVLEDGASYAGSATVVDNTYYTAYMPLRDYRGTPVGIVGIGAREEVYVDMRNRTVALFGTLIAVGMLFGFLMTYLFSAWLIRPIKALAEGMNRVAGGDFSHKVRIASADELGRLAQAFNLMVKAIQERDIQLRDMTEQRLSQVEKQVSIGRLAAGVAHEINNPLTSVLSLSILLQRQLPADDPCQDDLRIVVEETTRCRQIVRNLLDFAREQPSETRVLDLNQVIRETLVLTSKYDGMERIRVVTELSDEPLLVNADAKQLQQVFTNIVTNAAEATGERGKIFIRSDEDSSGAFVMAQVVDRGRGIPKEHLDRIFEPFFTTKETGKGTGLGLSVSLGIVRKHQGTIEVESEEGRGTMVTVLLPRVTTLVGGDHESTAGQNPGHR